MPMPFRSCRLNRIDHRVGATVISHTGKTPRDGLWLKRCLGGFYRAGVFFCIVWLIHDQHQARMADPSSHAFTISITLDDLTPFYPEVVSWKASPGSAGGFNVLDRSGQSLGYFIQTSPASDGIIGFSGPSNVLLAFDPEDRILGMKVLSSGDTREHLQKVVRDESFMKALLGLSWTEARAQEKVEGVSGATLTSLAIREGILARLNGALVSLRFPHPITLREAQTWFPAAAQLKPWPGQSDRMQALDASGLVLGGLARTSPTTDNLLGYQGPTDALLRLDETGQMVKGLKIRRSYDNQPYVGYVEEDSFFLDTFKDRSLSQLAVMDLDREGVEGVSGATMTSMAVAQGVVRSAQALVPKESSSLAQPGIRGRDAGTIVVLLGGMVMAFTSLSRFRSVRWGFQAVLIGYLGLINGDMVSMALLGGWARHGVAWQMAPGLAFLTLAALVLPLTTRRQVYCHHLCPHGAAQQWLKRKGPARWHLSPNLQKTLKLVPVLLLAWVLVVVMVPLNFSLVPLEPFDAYLFKIAGWGTLTVAAVGLVASYFVPMAYCRYGCPTGALLNFLWARGNPQKFRQRDLVALGLVLLALALRGW